MGNTCGTSHSLISGWGVHWLPYIHNRKRMKTRIKAIIVGAALAVTFMVLCVASYIIYVVNQLLN